MKIISQFIWMSIGKISKIRVNCFIKIMNDRNSSYYIPINIENHLDTLKILLNEFWCHYLWRIYDIPGIFASSIYFSWWDSPWIRCLNIENSQILSQGCLNFLNNATSSLSFWEFSIHSSYDSLSQYYPSISSSSILISFSTF